MISSTNLHILLILTCLTLLCNRLIELEVALSDNCDATTIRGITENRPLPESLRPKVWQVHQHLRLVMIKSVTALIKASEESWTYTSVYYCHYTAADIHW